MNELSLPLLLILLLLPIATIQARADIYTYTDEEGSIHLSNIPNDPRFKFLLRTPKLETLPAAIEARAYSADKKRYAPIVESAANSNQLESALLHAVISAESGYNPQARSPKGAIGLMQIMPDTARRYGITNPYDPVQNIQAGAQYLHDLMHMFNNDLSLTLAAYNAGENAVIRHGNKIPPYPETKLYVPKVLKYYNGFYKN